MMEYRTYNHTKIKQFDFKRDFVWRIFRIIAEFVDGFEFITSFKRPVTIFGSGRIGQGKKYYREARQLAKVLGGKGFAIVTGGGSGVMEAANRGAIEGKAESVGLNIQLPHQQRMNKYVQRSIAFSYFFSRKTILSMSAQAYVFFPGGYGTMDEFFTICTLMQTRKIERRPIVLYGSPFWKPLDGFIREKMLKDKAIEDADVRLYEIVDSVRAATKLVLASKERQFTSI